MAGFTYRKNLVGDDSVPATLSVIGKNSVTFTVGDIVRINTSGFVDISDSGEEIAGVVVGVLDKNGLPLTPDATSTPKTYTMASDNQTVAQDKVMFIPALPEFLFFNDADGSLAQSNILQFADVASSNQVTTGGLTDTATAQVRLIEIDPDHDSDASKGLFQIVESQFVGTTKGNTA